ncbi:class IV adenylate cyclase [Gracilinema caldarium]|uniref:class IV adenylate cyclase n=1 Tax=Gracilinema caldarium TaxID=215591 RepID=UPI0026E9A61F|nr:class IV adenylate cyclase [Gracilinema caldarium]
MATEIELKAWVNDPKQVKDIIETFAEPLGSYVKEDSYWLPLADISSDPREQKRGSLGSGVRIRQENGQVLVTLKRKEVQEGVEINDELEFSVSSASDFESFLQFLGFAPWIRKHKEGEAWRWQNITIELSLVQNLGWFAELEILAESPDPQTLEHARKSLLNCLEKIGIPETNIESRYYTELLLERGITQR